MADKQDITGYAQLLKAEITAHADKELERMKSASEYIQSNLEVNEINNDDSINPRCYGLSGMTFSIQDIQDIVEFCIMRMER